MRFENTKPRVVEENDYWKTNWYRILYDDMRFSLRPRDVGLIKTFDKMRLTQVGFKREQFQFLYDKEHVTSAGVQLDAITGSPPTLWQYIDSNLNLPYHDSIKSDKGNTLTYDMVGKTWSDHIMLRTVKFPKIHGTDREEMYKLRPRPHISECFRKQDFFLRFSLPSTRIQRFRSLKMEVFENALQSGDF